MNIGEDVIIHPTAIIKHPDLSKIGNHVAIDNGFTCSTKLEIGDYVHVSPYVVSVGGKDCLLILESLAFVATGTKIICGSEDYVNSGLIGAVIPRKYRTLILGTNIFRKYSGCGANCVILPNVVLAEGSIIGANSTVTKNTEPWTIYVGSPARPIGKRDKEKSIAYAKEMGY